MDKKSSQLKLLMSKARNEKLLKTILTLSENQESDEIAEVIQTLLDSLPPTKQKSVLNIINFT